MFDLGSLSDNGWDEHLCCVGKYRHGCCNGHWQRRVTSDTSYR